MLYLYRRGRHHLGLAHVDGSCSGCGRDLVVLCDHFDDVGKREIRTCRFLDIAHQNLDGRDRGRFVVDEMLEHCSSTLTTSIDYR
jgi:hypothetical protein